MIQSQARSCQYECIYTILVKICQVVLKILSGNKFSGLIKGRNSGTNVRKITCNNPKVDHVNINAHTKFS